MMQMPIFKVVNLKQPAGINKFSDMDHGEIEEYRPSASNLFTTPFSSLAGIRLLVCLAVGTLTLLFSSGLYAQTDDCRSLPINKTVRAFPDRFDLSSPVNSFVTFKYLLSEGKQGQYRSVNSYKIRPFFPEEGTPDIAVEAARKEALLNTRINQVLVYKDAVAAVLTDFQPPMQIITYLSLEDGQWLNAGEDLGNDPDDAKTKFLEKADIFLEAISRIELMKRVPEDTLPFTGYLQTEGRDPEEYILQALSEHRIVIYGELHRRQASWELMKRVINNPAFPAAAGTVFMELSSDKQAELDRFYGQESQDRELLLDIFRDVQLNGWYDRGMFEFLVELWKINNTLAPEQRIRIVAVDEPRPFRTFENLEQLEAHYNRILERNEQMATVVSRTIKSGSDKRNSLFIVGIGHAYKSPLRIQPIGSRPGQMNPSAGAQLAAMFSEGEVFTIFQHIPIISNSGGIQGRVRHGVFDRALAENGNTPVAFSLKGSPFGKEPFDALAEIRYRKLAGTYEDNFDAYLFLGPLETESDDYLFSEIITDDYLLELDRRAKMTNTTLENWFGVEKATVESIKATLQFDPDRKRWPEF